MKGSKSLQILAGIPFISLTLLLLGIEIGAVGSLQDCQIIEVLCAV